MGHQVIRCDRCESWVMEGRSGTWKCECGWEYNVHQTPEEAQDNPDSLLYKAADQIEELAWALAMFMDGTEDHDIQAETALSDEDCDRIASARKLARAIAFK